MNTPRTWLLVPSALLLGAITFLPQETKEGRVLDGGLHHLGDDRVEDWADAGVDPEGTTLTVRFRGKRNREEHVLELGQRDVHNTWKIELNGEAVASISKGDGVRHHILPAGSLRSGENVLRIVPTNAADDVVFGPVILHETSMRKLFNLFPVRVQVRDGDGGRPIAARISVTTPDGKAVPIYFGEMESQAVRPGVVYTSTGDATFEVSGGQVILRAARGMEWGMAEALLLVGAERRAPTRLQIRHEVATNGFIAADTHIHTLTHSGHGDSSMEERMVTLVGEGVELAIATDHNHNTDYVPTQKSMGLMKGFTAVVGNEVSTDLGHFNAFPLDPDDGVPPTKIDDYTLLVQGMRDKGARFVILNHPRWPAIDTGPYGVAGLDSISGDRANPMPITFDAMELANSSEAVGIPKVLLEDWFALLNHGEKITAVGSSDSHTVGNSVGQGRTYLVSSTDDASRIRISEATSSFREGRSSVSLGIFASVQVDGHHRMGDTVRVRGGRIRVNLRAAAPAWVRPHTATVYLNGEAVASAAVPAREGKPTDSTLTFDFAVPPIDAWLVCVVEGDGVDGLWWTPRQDFTLAVTNPIWLEADGRGSWSDPRATARMLLEREGRTLQGALAVAAGCGSGAVAVQAVSLAREFMNAEELAALTRQLLADRSCPALLRQWLAGA